MKENTPCRMARRSPLTLAIGVLAIAFATASGPSAEPPSLDPVPTTGGGTGAMSEILDALGQGRYWIEARYRYEYVEADKAVASGEQAYASTLRTVLGFESGAWNGFRGTIEFDDVSIIGNRQYYDGVTGDFAGVLPAVVDPEITAVNELFIDYDGMEANSFRLGRQTILLDNERFVGNVGWRQNDQTFDAFSVTNEVVDHLTLFYSYVNNVNTIKGTNVGMSSHLINGRYDAGEWGNVTGYAYLLDYDNNSLSSNTYGGRWMAKRSMNDRMDLNWVLEAATQSDAGNNKTSIDANYYHGEVAAKLADAPAGMNFKVGFEVLEGNEGATGDKFSTPLATGHKFNGWADMFVKTPDEGLQDVYAGISGKMDRASWAVIYHQFDAQSGNKSWGDEIDAILTYPCSKRVSLGVKAAQFTGDDVMGDVTKLWLWVAIRP